MNWRRSTNETEATLAQGCYMVAFALVVQIAEAIYRAWFGRYLWRWFLAPLGLPEIELWQMAGLLVTLGLLLPRLPNHAVRDDWKPFNVFVYRVCFPPFLLLVGWILRLLGVWNA